MTSHYIFLTVAVYFAHNYFQLKGLSASLFWVATSYWSRRILLPVDLNFFFNLFSVIMEQGLGQSLAFKIFELLLGTFVSTSLLQKQCQCLNRYTALVTIINRWFSEMQGISLTLADVSCITGASPTRTVRLASFQTFVWKTQNTTAPT